MKKILALILVLSCVFAMSSCKLLKKKTKEEAPEFDREAVAAVQAKIDASVPETAKVTVTYKSTLGTLNSEYNVFYNVDGTASVTYSYEKFNSPADASADFKTTYSGETVVNADGTLTGNPEGIASVEALTFDINLDPSKIYDATVSYGVLEAIVKAENTQAVLGVNIGADVKVIVTTGSLGVTSVAISYVADSGSVEIVATYTYYVAPEEEPEEGNE